MKKTILIVLGLVTVFCIIWGTYRHIGNGGLFDDDIFVSEHEEDNKGGHFTKDMESFSSIKVNTAVSSIKIEEGSSFRIEAVYNKESLKPEFEIRGGVLEVNQSKKRARNANNCKLIITAPSGTNFNLIEVNSNVGDIIIRDLSGEKLNLNVNVGEIKTKNIDFDVISCETNVGEVRINTVDSIEDYSLDVSADLGAINIDGRSHKKSYTVRKDGKKSITAVTNIGEIDIE